MKNETNRLKYRIDSIHRIETVVQIIRKNSRIFILIEIWFVELKNLKHIDTNLVFDLALY